MTKEQKFYKALQDVFIGARIEGEGGFVNLMRIKSNYYRKIEDILKKDIEGTLKSHPKFRDELFDKLYSFFSRYFTESGSIYFNSTPFHNNIYEKVYTDEKDVILFWKTQMLYYIKTDRIFRSLPVEFDGFKFYFDASKIESKKANEKRSLIFELNKIHEDRTIVFDVSYSEKGTKTKQDEILKVIKRKDLSIAEEQLERAFRVFEKQSEVDFFINKNAKAFLQEQFKLWSYQYFWEGAKEWGADRVNQLQILKDIAFKIIDFISQFEDELVKIWNKPKFVKNSNYVITLDRIKDISLVENILKNENINEQIKEWQEIGIVDENFKSNDIFTTDLTGKHLSEKYQHLPVDTKYFKDLELKILSQFEDLDKSLDGWLIKSENYQALNTILPKFKEKVQTIYIDPPFNTGEDFPYVDRFQDSSWLSLMSNRLEIAKNLINKKGSLFLHLDYNANYFGRLILNQIFEAENFRNEITWRRQIPRGMKAYAELFPFSADTILIFSKTDQPFWKPITKINRLTISEAEKKYNKDEKGYFRTSDPGTYSFDSLLKLHAEGRLYAPYGSEIVIDKKNKIIKATKGKLAVKYYRKKEGIFVIEETPVDNIWDDIPGLGIASSQWIGFYTQKPEKLLQRVIESTSSKNDLVMDFFLGSGTTTAVAHKLGRKWLGVEMGEHFYSVVLPRMKKVLAYDKSGISKEVKEYQGGGFFKYYELEQYEETLANCKYEDGDLFNSPSKTPYQEYVFMKDEKMLKALEIDYENNKVNVDLSKLYPSIDIAETLSNLTGKWIKKISNSEVEFEDGTKINTKDLDYKLIKPLIWW
jgi:adenine specific DNA methylase Mod